MQLMLAYANGLRVSELVQLRIEDIDGNRNSSIFVTLRIKKIGSHCFQHHCVNI
ncbi:MAG: hypothetical protein C0425_01755 [Chlorobiaceae bacterium]|nr:hypothetical protein [Chlorobiaceae bacterium]MBA4309044.1 hypothetical protein [Chlorobiaceae bacterium]